MPELHGQLTAALSDRYAIERQIGAGGMATVYLARDIKHDRNVALKVLNPDLGVVLGADRFLSEIRVTANLQHPNLLPLFDSGEADGLLFYVMPYVEGESLRATLQREKQLPVETALNLATAVASALDYAHRHGIIHRDLKPENILLHEGQPLVADFGIALAVSNAGGNRITQTGLSLGTPQYMSPEQATGDRVIDGRTDIYSLGAMLYEMLTGDPPHVGSTSQAVIARVLTEKPRSIRSTRPNAPEYVEAAVDRALEKLPADRFHTANEFADALRGRMVPGAAVTSAGTPAAPARAPGWRAALTHPASVALVFGVAALVGTSAWVWRGGTADSAEIPVRYQLVLPPDQGRVTVVTGHLYAFAPDGQTYAYPAAPAGGIPKLYVRRIDEPTGRAVPGTDSATVPTFSPDGQRLAFHARGQLRTIEIGGATSVRIADVPGTAAGISWGREQFVIGRLNNNAGLQVVPAGGGPMTPATTVDTARGEQSHRAPRLLADGETVLFNSFSRSGASRVAVASLRTGEHVVLDLQGVPLGMIGDLLVYHDMQGAILGVPFDLKQRRTRGNRIPLVDAVAFTAGGAIRATLSEGGSLIYLGGGIAQADRELVAVDMAGNERVVTTLRRAFLYPRYAPDGRRIAVSVQGDTVNELWTYDLVSQTLSPLTRGFNSPRAEWSPDGKDVVFSSNRSGRFELYRQRADGSMPAERIQPAGPTGQPVQGLFTPDGRYLLYRTGYHTTSDDLWYRALSGDTAAKPLVAEVPFIERNPSVSPDSRWVAYASNESGAFQIYVRPFPGPGPRYPVTVDGGNDPVWSRDGRKLYYRSGNRMEEATVALRPEFSVTRRVLFERAYHDDPWHRSYDLSRDGKHFLFVRPVSAVEQAPTYVVHRWDLEVRRRRAR